MNTLDKKTQKMNMISNNVLLELLILLISAHLCACDSMYTEDYVISEANLTVDQHRQVMYLKDFNEEMPKPCRTDLCPPVYNSSDMKGEFFWPEISIGQQVQLRCPYSFKSAVYTTRECVVVSPGGAQWGEADFEDICPDAPLAELVKMFQKEANDSGITHNKQYYEELLARTSHTLLTYREAPIEYQDVSGLMEYLTTAMDFLLVGDNSISTEVGGYLLDIWDRLMEEDLKWSTYSVLRELDYQPRLNVHMANLPLIISSEQSVLKRQNIIVYITSVTVSNQTLSISQLFDFNNSNTSTTVYSPNVSLVITDGGGQLVAGQTIKVGLTIVKDVNFLAKGFKWEEPATIEQPNSFVNEQMELNNKSSTTLYMAGYPDYLEAYSKRIIPYFEELGSIIFLNSSLNTSLDTRDLITITYDMHTCGYDEDSCLHQWDSIYPSCVKSSESSDYSSWSTTECTELTPLDDAGYTSCQCSGHGAYAVFMKQGGNDPYYPHNPPIFDWPGVVFEGDIASFLGFPYRKELEIVGNILGVISLACLLATVLSYAVFRNTRRGSPTTILLNLCVALMILSIMLFAINMSGTIMNMTGCTVSNALRYYLVFVTLMWNAVEAFNMYLMLIKVFDSNVSCFAMKAGIIAWGIPGLMVGMCLAVNQRAFNGQFILVNEAKGECVFKCQLRPGTLYYGYLLPMSVIILHNLIIFGFVLKAIIQHGNRTGKSTKENRRVQLIGAVATLVLLGVPWMFSAFGAIDANTNEQLSNMEGVFQVIFVLTINLQGLFIFIFHCARNAQMRQSWSSMVKGSSFRTKSTNSFSNSTGFSKTSSDKRKPPIPVDTVTRMPESQQFYNIATSEQYVN